MGITIPRGNIILESFSYGVLNPTIEIVASGRTAITSIIFMIKDIENVITLAITEKRLTFTICEIVLLIIKKV